MKKRTLVDANIIVHYLIRDNEEQYEFAETIFHEKELMTMGTIVSEVVYVLRNRYCKTRADIASCLKGLLQKIQIDDQETIESALAFYETTKLDYADCLLMAKYFQLGCDIATFDKDLLKEIKKRES